jgi:polysaccharide biosynthesis protein PslG
MIRRLVLLAATAAFVLSACSSGVPTVPTDGTPGEVPVEGTAGPVPTPRVLASPVPIAQALPGGKAQPGTMAVEVSLWGKDQTIIDRDLDLAKQAGFTWVKQRFEWRYIEPTKRGRFEWDEPDRIVDSVARKGLALLARVDNQPQWARGDAIFPDAGPPSDPEDWKDFLQELADRYEGRIHAYQLWNEPNLSREWGGNTPDAKAYVDLLKVGYAAINDMDKNALVISAGLSPTTQSSGTAISDIQFLREMYAAGVKDNFDVLGAHAPGFLSTPEDDPAKVAADPKKTNNDPSSVELKRVYAFRHLEDLRKMMVDNKDGDKQIWVLEMGWTSDPRPGSPYSWHAVSEEQKAKNLVDAFKYARANWASWIGLMSVIYIPDTAWSAKDEQFYWSITNPDGTTRPAYEALKKFGTGR